MKIQCEKAQIRVLTAAFLERQIRLHKQTGKGSFLLPDLVGTRWPVELIPFYSIYNNNKVAAQEMGKLLGRVAGELGLSSKKENRFGKVDAITRYFH